MSYKDVHGFDAAISCRASKHHACEAATVILQAQRVTGTVTPLFCARLAGH